MIYIAVCDDEEKSLRVLKERLASLLEKHNIMAKVTGYSQSSLLQYDIEEGKYFDLMISDIEMPHMDGMQLAKYIRKYLSDMLIIFVTSHMKYVLDSFEVPAFRYVPKNNMEPRFSHAVLDAVKMVNTRSNQAYAIDLPTRAEKIPYQKMLYIEKEGKYSVINLTDGNTARVRKSLGTVLKELDSEDFVFVNRGNIVNLQYIMKIKDGCVELENGVQFFISQARVDQIKMKISKYWRKRI